MQETSEHTLLDLTYGKAHKKATSKPTGTDVMTITFCQLFRLTQLLHCTIIALDWSLSVENPFGDAKGFDKGSHSKNKKNTTEICYGKYNFCNTDVNHVRDLKQRKFHIMGAQGFITNSFPGHYPPKTHSFALVWFTQK